jgi:hypothetical protein
MIRLRSDIRPKFAALLLGSALDAIAGELPSARAKVGDPFQQCEAISNALPRSLNRLRSLAPVISQRISNDVSEYCDKSKYKCRRVQIKMPGLKADLLEVTSKQVLSPLVIEISSNKWRLMKGVHVGQRVEELAAFYGIEAPDNVGAFNVCGEVACLKIQHSEQRVTTLRLDCQVAI